MFSRYIFQKGRILKCSTLEDAPHLSLLEYVCSLVFKNAGVCSTSLSERAARDGGAHGINNHQVLPSWALPERLPVGVALHL